jgi:hypothetical protein
MKDSVGRNVLWQWEKSSSCLGAAPSYKAKKGQLSPRTTDCITAGPGSAGFALPTNGDIEWEVTSCSTAAAQCKPACGAWRCGAGFSGRLQNRKIGAERKLHRSQPGKGKGVDGCRNCGMRPADRRDRSKTAT